MLPILRGEYFSLKKRSAVEKFEKHCSKIKLKSSDDKHLHVLKHSKQEMHETNCRPTEVSKGSILISMISFMDM
jgi:hypothetical protein